MSATGTGTDAGTKAPDGSDTAGNDGCDGCDGGDRPGSARAGDEGPDGRYSPGCDRGSLSVLTPAVVVTSNGVVSATEVAGRETGVASRETAGKAPVTYGSA